MSKKIFETKEAPAPIGPYSQAVEVNGILFVSGQIAIDPATGNLLTDNVEEETHRVMKNIEAILKEAGLGFSNIVKTSIFLSDMNLFAAVNQVYGSYFSEEYPARECVAVKTLPKNVNVEISVIVAR
ncbi:RidA family protein [Gynurincola endophyticus]|jgi:2-iminobutanoate/2-iminopropanoate deaminase|uniref:RidA family protein n=1 Tax=Gynurincola endophyticus TaxID=2479004 RepID=UPI000F8C307B|nr:RidA family protein [Gynurincola endophyticus]